MSLDKDKKSGSLFGNRLSSILNKHGGHGTNPAAPNHISPATGKSHRASSSSPKPVASVSRSSPGKSAHSESRSEVSDAHRTMVMPRVESAEPAARTGGGFKKQNSYNINTVNTMNNEIYNYRDEDGPKCPTKRQFSNQYDHDSLHPFSPGTPSKQVLTTEHSAHGGAAQVVATGTNINRPETNIDTKDYFSSLTSGQQSTQLAVDLTMSGSLTSPHGVTRNSTKLHRKPPPSLSFDETSELDELYFGTKPQTNATIETNEVTRQTDVSPPVPEHKISDSSSPSDQSHKGIDDLIDNLEDEIDNFLSLEKNNSSKNKGSNINRDTTRDNEIKRSGDINGGSSSSSIAHDDFQYSTDNASSASIVHQLRIARSPPLMALSSFTTGSSNEPNEHTEPFASESAYTDFEAISPYKINKSVSPGYSSDPPYPVEASPNTSSANDSFEHAPSIVNNNVLVDNLDFSSQEFANDISPEPHHSAEYSLSSSPASGNILEAAITAGSTPSLDSDGPAISTPQRRSHSSGIAPVSTNSSNDSARSMSNSQVVNPALTRSPLTPSSTFSRVPVKPSGSQVLDTIFSGNADTALATSRTVTTMASSASTAMRHRHSSSMSSIRSSNSYKNINLSTLKKGLQLKPGEGERSNYVLSIRRSGGTAFNETGPGKWKLPTGIQPVDKHVSGVNGRFMKSGINYGRLKKGGSGVELKHGHLQPRLLASEIDDRDDLAITLEQSLVGSGSNGLSKTTTTSDVKSSDSSIAAPSTSNSISAQNSLKRSTTEASYAAGDSLSTTTESTSESKRSSVSSDSSGSLDEIGGFYQHRGYKYNDQDDCGEDEENDTEVETNGIGSEKFRPIIDEEEEERPRLVLANPDYSSDSE
ncbi:hypothetical protein PICST_33802 [Scheffersomyces stipitis CBS 6054]|uniref:Uncharacterized protein n=1 Tax=Scheffersomyces stipitis (strain ATCC 58785 / CBS 6054 / NBRC 10063 / NRRL Y-11545) TaxID=322104 RepID=A3M066_PICST|nr:hypothetical protein PICST_33802 [Scheffersomyces stipitis CBS 6054]ABN68463.2 hypothetical protein PICST_33802 [Scheffersomyces stipitis CBS 6054]